MNNLFRWILIFAIGAPAFTLGAFYGETRILKLIQEGKLGIACSTKQKH